MEIKETITKFPSQIPFLDGMRAIAALMVLGLHFTGCHNEPLFLRKAMVIGGTGVDWFFVLSGFLITRILLRSKESPTFFSSFYARRILRIFPLYYAYLAIFFYVVPLLFSEKILPADTQIWFWVYLQNAAMTFSDKCSGGPAHFWSLAVEEHFYLAWPLLVYFLSRRHFTIVLGAVIVFPIIMRIIFVMNGIEVYFFTLTRIDSIGFGAILAVMFTEGIPQTTGTRRAVRLFRILLIGIPLIVLPSFIFLSGTSMMWMQVVKFTVIPAFYFAVMGFCLADPAAKLLTCFFSIGCLRWIGAISYGIYVFHPTTFLIVRRLVPDAGYILDFALSFGFTIAIAYLSFRFFESPILKLKDKFKYMVSDAGSSTAQQQIR
ncbi:MAG: acyltransferase [Victivallales bacterium]